MHAMELKLTGYVRNTIYLIGMQKKKKKRKPGEFQYLVLLLQKLEFLPIFHKNHNLQT